MDVVVTVPKDLWPLWIKEGDLPGQGWSGLESHFYLGGRPPDISPGERVYIVAHNRLRGYAPLVRVERDGNRGALVRHGSAVAVTIPEPVRGFRGWRERWWKREQEVPFPGWRMEGVKL